MVDDSNHLLVQERGTWNRENAGRGRLWNTRFCSYHLWLFFTAFFFIQPYYEHSLRAWILVSCVWALFMLLYVGSHARAGRTRSASLAGMLVLGLCYLPVNESSIGIFIFFAANAAARIIETRKYFVLLAIQMVCIIVECILFHLSTWTLTMGIAIPLVVGMNVFSDAQRRRADARLRLAHEEIEHLAKRAERERIARDMHDVLGHTLSMIVLKSELAGRLLKSDAGKAAIEIGDVEKTARTALSEVRQAIGGYRAESLTAELERTRRTLSTAGMHLVCSAELPALNPADETVLSLIVREAVTNIVRHANAHECRLSIETNGDHALLTVADDGRGGIVREGNGLRGMRERVESRGGTFTLNSENGTRLSILLPLELTS